MSRGTVVLDEIICHITDVTFDKGMMWVHATSDRGSVTVRESADISIFDPDGTLVFHCPSRGGATKRTVDGHLYVHLPVSLVP